MGAISELIKAAEEKQAVNPSAMASKLESLQSRAAEAPPASEAFKSLSQSVPTSEDESRRNALKWLAITGVSAVGIGALLRGLKARSESARREKLVEDIGYGGMPGREITIPIPVSKKAGVMLPAALLAAAAPTAARAAGSSLGEAWEGAKEKAQSGVEHLFAPTGSPFDNAWFLPAALAAGAGGSYLGYSQLDKILDKMRERRTERQLAKAKGEFESALQTQFREGAMPTPGGKSSGGGGFKFSSAGMMGFVADAFARAHVSGELQEQFDTLEKSAQDPAATQGFGWQSFKGSGRKAIGAYLAALALLGVAGGAAGYSFVKGREPKRRKFEMAKDIMRRRSMITPPTVTVEPAA